ncbi:MAG: hypothetical protein R3C01_10845 [Planctomycetaceae bacterium]
MTTSPSITIAGNISPRSANELDETFDQQYVDYGRRQILAKQVRKKAVLKGMIAPKLERERTEELAESRCPGLLTTVEACVPRYSRFVDA